MSFTLKVPHRPRRLFPGIAKEPPLRHAVMKRSVDSYLARAPHLTTPIVIHVSGGGMFILTGWRTEAAHRALMASNGKTENDLLPLDPAEPRTIADVLEAMFDDEPPMAGMKIRHTHLSDADFPTEPHNTILWLLR